MTCLHVYGTLPIIGNCQGMFKWHVYKYSTGVPPKRATKPIEGLQ